MPLHLNPIVKGRYVKLGNLGWLKLVDLLDGRVGNDAQGRHLIVRKKAGGPPLIYRGKFVDHCKTILDREAGKP